jgi:Transglycosylase SLT domain
MGAPVNQSNLPIALLAIPGAALLALICGAMFIAVAFGGAAGCGTTSAAAAGGGGEKFAEIPPELIPIYRAASAEYGLGRKGPAMLASINFHESTFGTNMPTSSAGAIGWMMFMPETWAAYGVDADGNGTKDPYDPDDAIHAAAKYLKASGAPKDWNTAIFAYNHAQWYVELILEDFERYFAAGLEGVAGSSGGGESCGEVSAPNEAVAKMIEEADRLSAMRPETEYRWGGSHGITPTPKNGPFDCSSAVSHLFQVGGFGNETMTTIGFHTWGKAGPGRWVTILNKPYEPEAHVILRFEPGVTPPEKRYWGTSGFIEGGGKGPGWIPESTFDAGYLSRFEERHAPGL